jgi:acetyl esterase/lipase
MLEQSRRSVILNAVGFTSLWAASATTARPVEPDLADDSDGVLPLWPTMPPGGTGVLPKQRLEDHAGPAGLRNRRLSGIGNPRLVVKRATKPNGAAMLVIPGGGYSVLNYDTGGADHARWLNAAGITAFILIYRLPGEGWAKRADVPLQDAQRAIRMIRAHADRWGIDPNRIGVLGSSAGGHLAGSLATRFDDAVYDAIDSIDSIPARPNLAALLFPVVTMEKNAHVPSRQELLGPDPSAAMRDAYSLERHVSPQSPATFLCCAGDDRVVLPVNSLDLYRSLSDAGCKAELHVFQQGGHGFGARLPASVPTSHWPELLLRFARYNGLFA